MEDFEPRVVVKVGEGNREKNLESLARAVEAAISRATGEAAHVKVIHKKG